MKPLYAAVALPVPLYRLFTYAVPPAFAGKVAVGSRVRVDFHGRPTVGVVLGLPETPDVPPERVKPLAGVVGDRPALDERGLALLDFVARRYGAAPGEAARLVAAGAPDAAARAENPLVTLAPDYAFRLGRSRGRTLLIVQYLENRGSARLADLARDTGSSPAAARDLLRRGILAVTRPDLARELAERRPGRPRELTPAQAAALAAIKAGLEAGECREFLLHGVTGSGKTEVYLRAMEAALAAGRAVLYLVPEIALVPQAVLALAEVAGDECAVWHSRMSPPERREAWGKVEAGRCRVVVGTRSAVFLPLRGLGLVVIDEEHDGSYRQSGDLGYDAREVARRVSELDGACLVAGSATPAVASYHRATTPGGPALLTLPERIDGRPLPETEVVNLLDERAAHPLISARLRDGVADCLAAGGQALLFLNRKGYATVVVCRGCGERVGCPDCDVTLTWHLADRRMRCHLCGHEGAPPAVCDKCGGRGFRYLGAGTERVVEEARRLFPGAAVMRFDAASFKDERELERALARVRGGGVDLLVGTQIFSKGHDIKGLSLVGVISADAAMAIPDHRAAERTFQMLSQVTGRAGRDETPGRAIVQTYSPDHYSVRAALTADYAAFFAREIEYRRRFGYPPFSRVARLLVTGEDEALVARGAAFAHARLAEALAAEPAARLLPPARTPVYRVARRFRMHAVAFLPAGCEIPPAVSAIREEALRAKELRGLALRLEVDPDDLL